MSHEKSPQSDSFILTRLLGLPRPPRWMIFTLILLVIASWLPLAMIALTRSRPSALPAYHLFQDMDKQPKYKAQGTASIFADGRAMRPRIEQTVARGHLYEDDHYYRGIVGDDWATSYPSQVTVDRSFLLRGKRIYEINCALCHGYGGRGDGSIHRRALELQTSGWVQPNNLHDGEVPTRSVGHLYNTVTYGIRNMAGYGPQIEVQDRWAVVAYVRALQLSQAATAQQVPDEIRNRLPAPPSAVEESGK